MAKRLDEPQSMPLQGSAPPKDLEDAQVDAAAGGAVSHPLYQDVIVPTAPPPPTRAGVGFLRWTDDGKTW